MRRGLENATLLSRKLWSMARSVGSSVCCGDTLVLTVSRILLSDMHKYQEFDSAFCLFMICHIATR
jgi:hypothetical protein